MNTIAALTCLASTAVWVQQAQQPPAAASNPSKAYSVVPVGQPQKAETLVGRGNKIEVIERNGAVKEINRKDLPLLNRARGPAQSSAPATPPGEADKKPAEGTEPTQENPGTTPTQEQGKEAGPKPPGKRETVQQGARTPAEEVKEAKQEAEAKQAAKERAEAIKKSNIEQLRKLEYQNAWFYDKSGKPISREELDKRIEKGDVGDIRATDIYLRNWKTEPEKTPAKGQGEGASSGADMQGK